MDVEAREQEVGELLETALGEPLAGVENPSAEQFEQWDSLLHLEIVFLIEERFGVRLEEDEIPELVTLRGILDVLERKNTA